MYLGIAGNLASDNTHIEIGLSIHDSTYTTDYSVRHVHFENAKVDSKTISDFIITSITAFSNGQ